jgi:hypothetical protein
LLVLVFLHLTWRTFFHYVEPGQMLVIIAKTGTPLPPGHILAHKGQKGIQAEVLGEGRHFVMPVSNETEIHPVSEIPPGQIGVVTAKVGTDLPPGQVLAEEGQKGIWRKVLPPGRHRLNPYGYAVQIRPAVRIRPGYVGFVTSLVGTDPGEAFARPGEKGVLKDVLQPGFYYLNPYEYKVEEVEVGINQVSFLKEFPLRFPSEDAFEIELEATVEWELLPENVAQVMAEFGKREAIEDKVIVPQSRSIGRIEGSKYGAKEFLIGQGREQFQDSFKTELIRIGRQKNLNILSAFIRHIIIPDTLLREGEDRQNLGRDAAQRRGARARTHPDRAAAARSAGGNCCPGGDDCGADRARGGQHRGANPSARGRNATTDCHARSRADADTWHGAGRGYRLARQCCRRRLQPESCCLSRRCGLLCAL